jgi:hypothetical protein
MMFGFFMILISFSCFGLLRLLVIELSFLAVHWCTPQNLAGRYAESWLRRVKSLKRYTVEAEKPAFVRLRRGRRRMTRISRMGAAKVRRFGDQSRRLMIVTVLRLTQPPLQFIRVISVIRG